MSSSRSATRSWTTKTSTVLYTIDNIGYTEGQYSVTLTTRGQDDLPFQEVPAKLIQDIRALDFVYDIPYSGYTVMEVAKEDSQSGSAPGEGGEGGGTSTKKEEETIKKMDMHLTITVKGDKVELNKATEEEG